MGFRQVLTTQLVINWLARVFFFASLSALLPTLPLYLVDIGGDESQVGLVMSAFAMGVFVFRPLVGKQIDTLGRKIVLVMGILIFIVSPLLYIFIESITLLIPVRIFHGLGLAAFGTASITLITDAASTEHRGEVLSYTSITNTLAFSGGPILGTFIKDQWGYTVLFGVVSMLAFSSLVMALLVHETRKGGTAGMDISYFQAVRQRHILVAFFMILLAALAHGGVMFFLPIFLEERVHVNIGLFFAIYGTASLLVRFIVGRLSDLLGRGPVIVGSLLCFSAATALLSQTTEVKLMIATAILYGVGFGSHQPTLAALVADNTTEDTRGKVFSFYYGGFDLGISIAGVFLGLFAEYYGIQSMIILCSALVFAALVIFVTQAEKTLRTSLRCAFTVQTEGEPCYTCDQYMEVTPDEAEAYYNLN